MDDDKKYKLTPAEFDELRQKLSYMEGEGRDRIVKAIAEARAHGDLSENAEYHAAREEQGKQESEIRRLRYMIENADVVETGDDDIVGPGKLVTIKHVGEEEEETYWLGVRDAKKAEHPILTPESPIGKAIIGRSPGDTVAAELPTGAQTSVEIVEVKTP